MTRIIAVLFSLGVLLVGPGWSQVNTKPAEAPNQQDLFIGTWKMNPEKSELDPNHRPKAAKMYWEQEADGYRMTAEGVNARGQMVSEAPQRFVPDGKEHPVPGAPGVTSIVTRPEPKTIQVESKKDGQIVGRASYVVSRDGKSLVATVSGMDGKQRAFRTRMMFDRE